MSVETSTFASADGLNLVANVAGPVTGIPVLLLHGGGQSRRSWSSAHNALAQAGFRAISVDQRGHGDSDWVPDADYRLDAFAADVRAIGAALKRPAFLVGASLGGIASALAIAEAPKMHVLGLVLVDVAHRSASGGAKRILDFMTNQPDGFDSLEEAADAIAAYRPQRPRPPTQSVSHLLVKHLDGRYRWQWDPAFVQLDRENSLALDAARISSALQCIAVPTLLVRGGSSEIVSAEIVAEFQGLMPHARCVDIPKATHMVAGDNNDAFASAMISFLSGMNST